MKKAIIFLAMLVVFFTAKAQLLILDPSFVIGLPIGDFRNTTDATGFGLGTAVMYQPATMPVAFGLDGNVQVYGSNSQQEVLTATITMGNTIIDQIHIPLKITTDNTIFNLNAIVRVMPDFNYVRPFIDGLIGFRSIATTTKIYDETVDHKYAKNDDGLIVSKKQLGDMAFSYGGALGVMVDVGRSKMISIQLKGSYTSGGNADYFDGSDTRDWKVEFTGLDPNDIEGEDLNYSVKPRHSATDMLTIHLGVAFRIPLTSANNNK
jgi:hypothetical protein